VLNIVKVQVIFQIRGREIVKNYSSLKYVSYAKQLKH